jgi:hypothetical protein
MKSMGTIHMTMQGKGGVGKTFVAALIAQFLSDKAEEGALPLKLIDTDPVNCTFTQYRAWPVEQLRIQDEGSTRINERHFDALMENLLTQDADFVIDNGAASFVPLSNYFIENDAIRMLIDAGHRVCVHAVITGGQGLDDTVNGFIQLAKQLPDGADLYVWLNPYFGKIEHQGKTFQAMAAYKNHKDRIRAIIEIPAQSSDTFGADMRDMLEKKLTFNEAVASDQFSIMSRQRLSMVRKVVYERLANALAA